MQRRRYTSNFGAPQQRRRPPSGIRARAQKGQFGESWWARRWIEMLESFEDPIRIERGRTYARRGQVLSIEIENDAVKARVQGSEPIPYDVRIRFQPITRDEWGRLAHAITERPIFAAKLLGGEMPTEIEEVFKAEELSLFPSRMRDLDTACTCADWSHSCKHVVSVHYLLGEEFDRDPFLIFSLRGMPREKLVSLLGGRVAGEDDEESPNVERIDPEPLTADPRAYWGRDFASEGLIDRLPSQVSVPEQHATLPRRLGPLPFWRGEPFLPTLEYVYRRAAELGLEVFLDGVIRERSPQPPPEPTTRKKTRRKTTRRVRRRY